MLLIACHYWTASRGAHKCTRAIQGLCGATCLPAERPGASRACSEWCVVPWFCFNMLHVQFGTPPRAVIWLSGGYARPGLCSCTDPPKRARAARANNCSLAWSHACMQGCNAAIALCKRAGPFNHCSCDKSDMVIKFTGVITFFLRRSCCI